MTSQVSNIEDPSAVRLRALDPTDRFRVRAWMSDLEVIRYTVLVPGPEYAPARPYSCFAADEYLSTLISDPKRRAFAIERGGQHVGNVGLKDLDLQLRTSECFIEIGEQSARGHGVGRRAMQLLLDFAKAELNLAKVRLGVFEFNTPAIRLYERLGFRHVGNYGWHWAERRFWEVLEMQKDI